MRRKISLVVAVAAMSCLIGAGFATTAGAGGFDETLLPSITVTKTVVKGPLAYDVTGLFTVQVACVDTHGDDDFTATLKFNPDGTPNSGPGGWVNTGTAWFFQDWDLKNATCTVTEQAGGAASFLAAGSPTYACSFTNEKVVDEVAAGAAPAGEESDTPGCLSTDGVDPAVIHLGSPWDHSCLDDAAAEESSCICVQSGFITVTNTIADDPVKVAGANAAAVPLEPKFAG